MASLCLNVHRRTPGGLNIFPHWEAKCELKSGKERKNRSKKPPLGLGAAKEGNSSCHKIPTVFENIKRLYFCFGWFACYCHAFHPSQDIAVFAVFEFVDLQMKPLHSAFHRTVITSKLCILSSLLTILFFCYFSYCSDGFSSIWCCLISFVSALCSESWAHGLHIFRWLRHLCVQSTVINLAIKIALSTPSPSSSLIVAIPINCHHGFIGVLVVIILKVQ